VPSLNTLQPEQVAHGAEITVTAQLPGVGSQVVLAECYEIDFDEDQGIINVPTLGSRINGARQGRFKVTGTLKLYWVNQMARAMLSGINPPTASGASAATLYHSARPFARYDIRITGLGSSPVLTIKNVVFEKDAIKWGENSLSDETVTFQAEDVQGN
jgi:hypothetical protein